MALGQNTVIVLIVLATICGQIDCEVVDDGNYVAEGRTFAHHFLKRISFAVIPAAFVVGVITTLLAALTVVSIKSVGIGSILLVLALGQLLARSLPQAAQPYSAAPLPVVYSHSRSELNAPGWVEKGWSL